MKKYLTAIFFLLLIIPADYVRAEACMGDGVTYNQYVHAFNDLAGQYCNPPYTYPRDFCVVLDTGGNPVNLVGELTCVADMSALPPIGGGYVPDEPLLDAPLPYGDPLGNLSIDFLRDGINNLWDSNRINASHLSQSINTRSNRLERLVDIVGSDFKAQVRSLNDANTANTDRLMAQQSERFALNKNDRFFEFQEVHSKLDAHNFAIDGVMQEQARAANNWVGTANIVDDVRDTVNNIFWSLGDVGDATEENQLSILQRIGALQGQVGMLEGRTSSWINSATGNVSTYVAGSTATITSALGSQTGEIMTEVSRGFRGVNDRLDALEEGSGDGLTTGDIVGAFNSEFQGDAPSDGLGGFYERRYGSLESVFNDSMEQLRETPLFDFVDSFSFDAAAEIPSWNMCFDLGIVNLGCSTLEVPPHVWSFIRIVMLLSASFLARKMIIGG